MTTGTPVTNPATLPKALAIIGAALLGLLVYLLLLHGTAQTLATSLALRLMPDCKLQQGAFSNDFSSDFDISRQTCTEGRFTVEFAGGKLARVSVEFRDTDFSIPPKG